MGRRPFDPGRRRGRPAQDRRSRPRIGVRGRRPGGSARGKWSAAIRERFLALLRETGNVAATLRAVGHPSMFYKRRRRDAAFAADWAAALAEADARLGTAESAFPALRPGSGQADGMGTVTSNCPRAEAVARLGAFALPDPATLLRPGPKRKPKERGHVIRRARGGRVQIALAHEGHMNEELEAEFLARLRATGNFSGSARAMGFQPASLFDRCRKWPAFAKACDEALAEASIQLDYALVAHAHKLLRTEGMGTVTLTRGGASFPRGERESDCPLDVPFDPDRAMRILAFLDRRRGRGTGRGRRKGPPDRSFDEAVASVLAKIAAIERHKKMMQERGEDGDHGDGKNGDGHE